MLYDCHMPTELIPAVNLPDPLLEELVSDVARLALDWEDTVTLVGTARVGESLLGHLCHTVCRYHHPGSIVVIPDTVMMELHANGWDELPTVIVKLSERSVYCYRIASSARV